MSDTQVEPALAEGLREAVERGDLTQEEAERAMRRRAERLARKNRAATDRIAELEVTLNAVAEDIRRLPVGWHVLLPIISKIDSALDARDRR